MRHSTRKKATHFRSSPTVSATHPRRITRACLLVIIGLAGLVGGYRFQRVLSALPDSNDDFIFF
jgi:hypothetical protein